MNVMRIMILKNNFQYTLIILLMILISILGFTFRDNRKKNFYLPIGIIGIFLVAEKEYNRKNNRKEIFNKIKNFLRK